jgi:hypothetical protein
LSLPVWRSRKNPTFHSSSGGEQVVRQVGVVTEPANTPMGRAKRDGVPGVLERLPCRLEEVPVLRVHDGGFVRAHAEEAGVEALHVVERRAAAHIVRVGQQCEGTPASRSSSSSRRGSTPRRRAGCARTHPRSGHRHRHAIPTMAMSVDGVVSAGRQPLRDSGSLAGGARPARRCSAARRARRARRRRRESIRAAATQEPGERGDGREAEEVGDRERPFREQFA